MSSHNQFYSNNSFTIQQLAQLCTTNIPGQLEVHTNSIHLFLQALGSTIDCCTIHNAKVHVAITTPHPQNMAVAIIPLLCQRLRVYNFGSYMNATIYFDFTIMSVHSNVVSNVATFSWTQLQIYSTQSSIGIYMIQNLAPETTAKALRFLYCTDILELVFNYNGLTSLGDGDSSHICTQIIGDNTDVDPILVHLSDIESEIAICKVRVQASGFSPCQYPGVSNGRVPSGCTHQVNRLAQDHQKHWIWLYSNPTGWICGYHERYIPAQLNQLKDWHMRSPQVQRSK